MFKRKLCNADGISVLIINEQLITFEHSFDKYVFMWEFRDSDQRSQLWNNKKLEIHSPHSCDRYTEIGRIALDTCPIHTSCPDHRSPVGPCIPATAKVSARKTSIWTRTLRVNICSRFFRRFRGPIWLPCSWSLTVRLESNIIIRRLRFYVVTNAKVRCENLLTGN